MDGVYRQVERCGRVCYKSENHQTADSARPFVERMIASKHTAMLEHATIYLTLDEHDDRTALYRQNRFTHVNMVDGKAYVTTNLRVLVENGRMDDLKELCEPTVHHYSGGYHTRVQPSPCQLHGRAKYPLLQLL